MKRCEYPEWLHRQGGSLVNGVQGLLLRKRFWITDSELNLLSLTPFSVAGCCRLQPRVAYLATSLALLQVIDNLPHKQW